MSDDPVPFDVCAELPSGTTVLEASAGTGKTYTIAALTARAIAEGVAELNQLLLVTFGRKLPGGCCGWACSHQTAQPARGHAHHRSPG